MHREVSSGVDDEVTGLRCLLFGAAVGVMVTAAAPAALSDSAGRVALDPQTVMQQSAVLYAQGNLDGAVRKLRTAVAGLPAHPQLRFMLANGLFRQQEWLEAAQHYAEAARLRPLHPDTHLNLGYAWYRAGQADRAIAAWRRAVEQTPADALPHYSLAIGLLATGRPTDARHHAGQAFDRDPDWKGRLAIDIRWTPEMLSGIERLITSIEPHDLAAGEG